MVPHANIIPQVKYLKLLNGQMAYRKERIKYYIKMGFNFCSVNIQGVKEMVYVSPLKKMAGWNWRHITPTTYGMVNGNTTITMVVFVIRWSTKMENF